MRRYRQRWHITVLGIGQRGLEALDGQAQWPQVALQPQVQRRQDGGGGEDRQAGDSGAVGAAGAKALADEGDSQGGEDGRADQVGEGAEGVGEHGEHGASRRATANRV